MRPAVVQRDHQARQQIPVVGRVPAMRPAVVQRDHRRLPVLLQRAELPAMRPAVVQRDHGSRYFEPMSCGNGRAREHPFLSLQLTELSGRVKEQNGP